jgi:hypothetical protein
MKKEYNPVDLSSNWLRELSAAKREDEKWVCRGKKIVKRYKDERGDSATETKKYNILWSNIQTLFPALYGKTPKAEVERRNKDSDPVGRTAAQILERALQFEIDNYPDLDLAMKATILDRLLPGRGTCWVRLEDREISQPNGEIVSQAAAVIDTVYWEDFRCSPARNWGEVTWLARRVYMTKKDVVARFGEEHAGIALTFQPIGLEEMIKNGEDCEHMKKAQVWEIWDKSGKEVCWVAEGYDKALDCIDDPYGLDQFWPCPMPLYATQTSDTLVPVPDFSLYQDQADEIDMLTQRIALLAKALRLVGVYDASQTGIKRMVSEQGENELIPVEQWAAFSEKGGIKGVVDWMPLDMVVNALQACYAAREQAKQVIYEITGLSDIVRGASVASETATAQQIKSQFGSLRLNDRKRAVAMFASELIRIKAQLMSDFYPPQQLVEMSGIMGTQDAQYVEPAIQLLQSEPLRGFRIEVAADSLIELDEQAEKSSRMEFLTAAGSFLQQALPVAQQAPEMAPLLGEMLMFGVRSFKGGRSMEAAFDSAMAQMSAPKPKQPPQPDPEQIKMQGQMQIEQMRQESKRQSEEMAAQVKLQSQQIAEQAKTERDLMLAEMKMNSEAMLTRFVEMLKAEVALNTAQISANATLSAQQDAASEQSLNNTGE